MLIKMASLFKFSIGVILSILIINGTIDFIFKIHPNKCEMTYMFQNPQFIKIHIPQENVSLHKYGLYAYGEGMYAEELRKGIFKGIPVLFIPGNQGSHKQVRSLGSVAYRKAVDEKHSFHFNFFSVDFNEELSAFYGPVLWRQTQFVALAMRRIFELYEHSKHKPSSIILVGHSLGGLVARAVLMLPEVPASQVPLIITQATPHTRPVIVLDPHVANFYNKVNKHWEIEKSHDFVNTVFVSIGGGRNDVQVSNLFTSFELADVDATTLSVPSCWLTADHLAIVWCRQLVLATTRALFHSVDPSTRKISDDRNHVINAFKFQLEERSGSKHSYPPSYPSTLSNLEKSGIWSEIIGQQNHHLSLRPSKHAYLMIPVYKDQTEHELITIIGRELDWKNWIFACKADRPANNVTTCSSGMNLSPTGRIIPGNKKEVNINLNELSKTDSTHIVIWIHPSDDKVQVAFDISEIGKRHENISAPTFLSSFSAIIITEQTPSKALSFNLTIDGLTDFWQSYILSIVPHGSCTSNKVSHPHVSMSTSWNPRWEYLMSSANPFEFALEVDVPFNNNSNYEPTVNIHIILYQNCTYKISLQKSFWGIFKRMSLLYGPQFPAFIACQFLLVLSTQMKSLATSKNCPSVFSTILALTPMAVVPFTKLLSSVISRVIDFESDPQIMARHNIDLGMLPLMLFLAILPISLIIASTFWILVIGFGNATHSLAVKLLKRSIRTGDILTEMAIAGFWKVPFIAAVGLISLAFGSCGALALSLGAVLYFINVFKLYEDYLESFLISLIPGTREAQENGQALKLSTIHLHFTLMILTILISVINLPSLITWSNFAISVVHFPDDPSLVSSILCLMSHGVMWQIKNINPQKKYYKELGNLLHFSAVMILLFGTIHLYRISYIVSVLLLIIAIHQLIAPSCEPSQESNEEMDVKSELSHMEVVEEKELTENHSSANCDTVNSSSSESNSEQ